MPDRYIGKKNNWNYHHYKLEIEDNPGLLVYVDFYEAFGIIDWSFIKKAFEYFSFPGYLLKWISIIYNSIDSLIINNGHVRGYIVNEEVRQGVHCPQEFLSLQWNYQPTAMRPSVKIKIDTQMM